MQYIFLLYILIIKNLTQSDRHYFIYIEKKNDYNDIYFKICDAVLIG